MKPTQLPPADERSSAEPAPLLREQDRSMASQSRFAAMGPTMYANADPDASLAVAGGFVVFALASVTLNVFLYRPFFTRSTPVESA